MHIMKQDLFIFNKFSVDSWFMVFNATFNTMSAISWGSVL